MPCGKVNLMALPTFQQLADALPALREEVLKTFPDKYKDVKISQISGTDLYYSDGAWSNCIAKIEYVNPNDSSYPVYIMPNGLYPSGVFKPFHLPITEAWYMNILKGLS